MWNKTMKKGLLLAGLTILSACGKNEQAVDDRILPGAATRCQLTLQASKNEDAKALSLDGNVLNAWWKDTETIAVYSEDLNRIGTLDVIPDEGERPVTATLSGEIDVTGLSSGSRLQLALPDNHLSYLGQDGTLETIESGYDYALAVVIIDEIDTDSGIVTTTSDASFQNKQSIYRFGFLCGGNRIPVKSLTVSSVNNALVRSQDDLTNYGSIGVNVAEGTLEYLYTALRNTRATSGDADTYSFDVVGADNTLYLGEKEIPAGVLDKQGRFIGASSIAVQKAEVPLVSLPCTQVW